MRYVKDGGRIVQFSTGATKQPRITGVLYAASKAAGEQFVSQAPAQKQKSILIKRMNVLQTYILSISPTVPINVDFKSPRGSDPCTREYIGGF
ncbi:MAG: SDR family oxidoreductase [Acaryochloridaceae cyanobacterium RU_4_10]|nr:SDR family oxidoreductase [Acaryochloridaceae cyanobacterium RU_4_10]